MHSSKDMYEYIDEINRLFPRNTENDIYTATTGNSSMMPLMSPDSISGSYNIPPDYYHTPTSSNTMHSPLQQSTSINRSSSSADSASSGSFPDMSYRDRFQTTNQSFDTSFTVRRQRPIVGRKIFDSPKNFAPILEPTFKAFEEDLSKSIWHPEDQHLFPNTPPKEHKSTQNVFYELFPKEQRGFEFRTPMSPQSADSNYSRQVTSIGSPIFTPPTSNISPTSSKFTIPRMPTMPVFPNQLNFATCSNYDLRPNKMCTFCRKNGETPLVYMNHTVKEKVGNQNIVTCPILRSHVCSTCGASGDNAHTITYCPVLRSSNNGLPLQSTTITLKNTRIKSNGRRRY